jgi:hypothetical protein
LAGLLLDGLRSDPVMLDPDDGLPAQADGILNRDKAWLGGAVEDDIEPVVGAQAFGRFVFVGAHHWSCVGSR